MTVSPPPGSHCCLLLALARRHSFALSAGRSVCLSGYLAVGPRHTRRASNNQTSFSLIKRRSVQAHDHGNHISRALSYGKRPNLEGWNLGEHSITKTEIHCSYTLGGGNTWLSKPVTTLICFGLKLPFNMSICIFFRLRLWFGSGRKLKQNIFGFGAHCFRKVT